MYNGHHTTYFVFLVRKASINVRERDTAGFKKNPDAFLIIWSYLSAFAENGRVSPRRETAPQSRNSFSTPFFNFWSGAGCARCSYSTQTVAKPSNHSLSHLGGVSVQVYGTLVSVFFSKYVFRHFLNQAARLENRTVRPGCERI